MTQSPRFYPFIGDNNEFVPMFQCKDERSAKSVHRFYLSESVPHYYRLCTTKETKGAVDCGYIVRCPYCGEAMQTVALPVDTHRRALYACKNCN